MTLFAHVHGIVGVRTVKRGAKFCRFCKKRLRGVRGRGIGLAGQCDDRDGCLRRQRRDLQELFKKLDLDDMD